jgi:hypothetical protein
MSSAPEPRSSAPRPASVRAAAPTRAEASLRAEFRAIGAVYLFSALLPLLAGFACSSEREHRLRQRERAETHAPETAPEPRPAVGATQG